MAKKYERKGEVFEVGFSPKGLEVSYKGEIGYVGVDRINGDLVGRPYTVNCGGQHPHPTNRPGAGTRGTGPGPSTS